ncbi:MULTISPECIES: hypothetical protein [Rhizobium]|uniref:hypothetical protein n=1 Tax=Rhizobium TaxID=379 RepID=UPI001111F861|nr:hypothetical protein [Rhizobium miluonense]
MSADRTEHSVPPGFKHFVGAGLQVVLRYMLASAAAHEADATPIRAIVPPSRIVLSVAVKVAAPTSS